MLNTKSRNLALLLAAGALAASGCGSSKDSSAKSAAPIKAADGSVSPNQSNQLYSRVLDNAKQTVDTSKYKKSGPYTIAALTQGPINGWGTLYDAQLKAAAQGNAEIKSLKIYPSMAKPQQEIKDLELLVNQKPDAIIATPMSVAALAAPLMRAKAAGIPIINCMARSDGSGWVTEVGQPLYPMGFEAVSHLARMLGGKGDIIVLNGIPGVDAGELWKAGAKDALKEYPGLKVLAEGDANWSPGDAKKVTTGFIAAHPKIDGVLTMGMEMGVGALNAFVDAGKPIPPMSGTGSMNGFNRLAIDHKNKFWSISYPPSVSKVCLDVALDVLHGKSVPKYVDGTKRLTGQMEFNSENVTDGYKPALSDEFPLGPTAMGDSQLATVFGKK
jgi:ribose transport system substrate-binding protein